MAQFKIFYLYLLSVLAVKDSPGLRPTVLWKQSEYFQCTVGWTQALLSGAQTCCCSVHLSFAVLEVE